MKSHLKKYIKSAFVSAALALILGNAASLYAQTNAQTNGTATSNENVISVTDAIDPSDVENLKALAGDGEVTLTWNPATDNVGVAGYKVYRGTTSVENTNMNYDLPVIPVGNATTYTVKNLTNGQVYYFSVTALDAGGNESVHYALEVSATPESGLRGASFEDDARPPQVKEVKSEDMITVLVIWSEPVKLPEEHPVSAFQIEKISDKSRLEIQKAEIDARDETGQTVLLETAPQEKDAEYIVTAGIEIEDYLGNPVVSGTSDTGSFRGNGKTHERLQDTAPPAEAENDSTPPVISNAAADFNNRISVNFSEKIVLPDNPKSKFAIYKKGTENPMKIINISLSVDGKTAYITTDPQEQIEYEVKVLGVKDEAGNEIASDALSVTVAGAGASLRDLIPPEDVTDLIAKIKDAEKHIVELRWKASVNSERDLADQLLYKSEGKKDKDFGNSVSLGSSTEIVDVEDLQGGKWYTFKLTAKDTHDNESVGAVTSIYLPETGPELLAAGLTALFMGWYAKKKKK